MIISSAAAANAAQTTAIGYADSADGLIPGQPANTIELKYTLYGDTTLAGSVGFNDFTRLTQHYNQTSGGTWDTGDFNYDGSVNLADFTLMTRTYNTSVGSQALLAVTGSTPSTGSTSSPQAGSGQASSPQAPTGAAVGSASSGSPNSPSLAKKPPAVQVNPAPPPAYHAIATKAHKKRHR